MPTPSLSAAARTLLDALTAVGRAQGPRRAASWGAFGLAVALLTVACGGSSSPDVADPGAVAIGSDAELPDGFPERWEAPEGAVLIDVIEATDDPTVGPSATWRHDVSYEDSRASVELIMANIGWTVVAVNELDLGTNVDADYGDRAEYIVDNGEVYSVQVFRDPNLRGVRITVEMPAELRRGQTGADG